MKDNPETGSTVATERARCLSLLNLCPTSRVSLAVRSAVENGTSMQDFAISIVQKRN